MYTVVIRVSDPEAMALVKKQLGDWVLRLNCPQWQVDFPTKAEATLALYNLNGIRGVRANRAGWPEE